MNSINNSDLFIKKAQISLFNKIILAAFSFKSLIILRKVFALLLHLDLPPDSYRKKIRFGHPYNIIINSKAKIGHNVTIHQNVTIGSKQFGHKRGVPTIEDNVIIYSHSVILGNIIIGANAIVGAGSVVLHDVPPNTIVAGNPARNIGNIIMDC